MRVMGRLMRCWLPVALLLAAGCETMDGAPQQLAVAQPAGAEQAAAAAEPEDVPTIEEEIRRFRDAVGGEPVHALAGGSLSRDELVRRFVAALEANDASALGPMQLTAREFIDLYYPHTRFTSRPYELSPQLVWFQLENYGSRGIFRAINRFAGHDLQVRGHRCETLAEEGPNRIHGACLLDLADPQTGERQQVSLFGQVIERDGQFKFISYGNRL